MTGGRRVWPYSPSMMRSGATGASNTAFSGICMRCPGSRHKSGLRPVLSRSGVLAQRLDQLIEKLGLAEDPLERVCECET